MYKRIIALLSAISMIGCCFSCSGKKESEPDVSEIQTESETGDNEDSTKSGGAADEPVGDTEEQGFREYSEDYFQTINVSRSVMDKAPPFELHHKEMADMDFGKRIAPCKNEQYGGRYLIENKDSFDEVYYEKYLKSWKKSCNEPYKGSVLTAGIYGDDIYAVIDYDILCPESSHELSVFRINSATNESKEIFRHSDPGNSLFITQLHVVKGEVFAVTVEKGICRLDEEKGGLVPIPGTKKDFFSDYYPQRIVENTSDRLIVEYTEERLEPVAAGYEPKGREIMHTSDTGENFLSLGYDYSMKEYDFETKEWKELYSAYKPADGEDIECTEAYPQLCGKLFAWKEKPYGSRKYDVITDRYRVSTGLTNCELVYASEDRLVVNRGDFGSSNGYEVNVYDLKKGEHYIFGYEGLGTYFDVFGDSIVISSGEKRIESALYADPARGLVFPMRDREVKGNSIWSDPYKITDKCLSFAMSCIAGNERIKDENDVMNYKAMNGIIGWYTEEKDNE